MPEKMDALLVGRFHALTRAQGEVLAALGRDPAVERVVCVLTSADHHGTRRNPLDADTREAILRPALEALGKPFDLLRVSDIADDAAWPAHVAAAVAQATGRALDPARTTVYTANREVARLFAAANFRITD